MGFFTRRATLLSMFGPVAVALAGCSQPASTPAPAAPAAPAMSAVERGKMLVMGGGCHDCHTPKKIGPNGPEADLDKTLSGLPASEIATVNCDIVEKIFRQNISMGKGMGLMSMVNAVQALARRASQS